MSFLSLFQSSTQRPSTSDRNWYAGDRTHVSHGINAVHRPPPIKFDLSRSEAQVMIDRSIVFPSPWSEPLSDEQKRLAIGRAILLGCEGLPPRGNHPIQTLRSRINHRTVPTLDVICAAETSWIRHLISTATFAQPNRSDKVRVQCDFLDARSAELANETHEKLETARSMLSGDPEWSFFKREGEPNKGEWMKVIGQVQARTRTQWLRWNELRSSGSDTCLHKRWAEYLQEQVNLVGHSLFNFNQDLIADELGRLGREQLAMTDLLDLMESRKTEFISRSRSVEKSHDLFRSLGGRRAHLEPMLSGRAAVRYGFA